MIVIVDRFEGSFAVVELSDKTTVNVPRVILPHDTREGSVIRIEIDQVETDKRKVRISNLMTDLFRD